LAVAMRERKTFPEQASLAHWLDEGLKKTSKSAKELAAVLGIDPTAVTRMRQNERRFQAHELHLIAQYIEEPTPSLDGTGFFRATLVPNEANPWLTRGVAIVRAIQVTVIIAPGVWREAPPSPAIAERIAGSADPRVMGLQFAQYACRLESQPNRYAICVPYDDIRSRPMASDTVHVRRTRGGQYEDTIRVVRVADGRVRLQLEGAADIDYPMAVGGDDVEIKGLVIGYYETVHF
jgi:hypothetical protein